MMLKKLLIDFENAHCEQCLEEIRDADDIGLIFLGKNNKNIALCNCCTKKLANDATIGQYIRIHKPKMYEKLISVPIGKLL